MAKQFFMEGYTVSNIRAAFSVGYVLGVSCASLIISENTAVLDLNQVSEDIWEFSVLFPVNINTVGNSIMNNPTVIEAQNETTTAYEALVKLATDALYELYSTSDDANPYVDLVEDKLIPPSKIDINDKESINLSTGDVLYSENLLHIPGMNGMDLNLNIKYNSGESNLTKFTNRVLINKYRLEFVQTLYADTPFGLVLLAEYPYAFVYNSRSEAENERDYLITRSGASAVLPYPYYDTRTFTQQYPEYITYNGYLNPQELISVTTNPNPLLTSLYYNDGLYYGNLPKISSTLVYDTGIVVTGMDFVTGRPMWTQVLQYNAIFSGIIQATYNTGIETFSNFNITGYMVTDDTVIQDNTYPNTYFEERYNIGSGWSFDLPALEASFDSTVYQVHLPDKGSFQFIMDGNIPKFVHPITEVISDTMFDMNISIDGTFSNGELTSIFKL